jgi:hypothetical protein
MRFKKTFILLWIAINIVAVLMMNEAFFKWDRWHSFRDRHWDSRAVKALDSVLFSMSWYAYLTGLDQRYSMFSQLHRMFTWYEIKAHLEDGELVLLPIEVQSSRSFFQRHFVDHKAGKFHLNMYFDGFARKAYSFYLCREFHEIFVHPVDHIEFEQHYRLFASREEALATGTHFLGTPVLWKSETFQCL